MTLTDAHCHLQDPVLTVDLEQVLERSSRFGIKQFVVNGTCPEDWEAVSVLATRFSEVIPQFGVHPWKVENLPSDWMERLKGFLLKYPQAGIGEIGLDGQLTDAPMQVQQKVFNAQFQLAREWERPCTIHVVKAWPEFMDELKEGVPSHWLLHSFGGSSEQLKGFAEKGAYFSFGGAVIRHSNSEKLQNAVRKVPDDRLLLETDAPFQHPQGKDYRQEPTGLLRIAERIAELRGINIRDLSQKTERNLKHFIQ